MGDGPGRIQSKFRSSLKIFFKVLLVAFRQFPSSGKKLAVFFHIGRHGGIHVFRAQVRQFFVPFPQQVSRIPAAFFQARKGRVLFQFQEALHQCVAFFRVFRIDVRHLFPVGDGRITAGGHQERGQHREHAPQENRGIHLSFVACPGRESRVFSVSPVAVSR